MNEKKQDTDLAIRMRGVTKIFGDDPKSALELLRAGKTKTEVQAETNHVVGLDNVSLDIARGQIFVVMGLSGSGKSTLIRHVNRLIEPTAGEIIVEGTDVLKMSLEELRTYRRNSVAMVFQKFGLLPHRSVIDNVAYGLEVRGVPKAERRPRVEKALDMVGLGHTALRRIDELSGGQRQRIALARALVVEPSVLLLDEPLGALDLKLRRQMQEELKAIQKRVGTTFVHVTHDQEEAMAIADVIVVMNEGSIEDQGTPERIYLQPASRFAANFMGDNNLIEGRVTQSEAGKVRVTTPLGDFLVAGEAESGASVALSLRPEHLHPETGDGRVALGEGKVIEAGFFGTHHQCSVALEGHDVPLKLRLPQKRLVQPGETLPLHADPADMVLLTR